MFDTKFITPFYNIFYKYNVLFIHIVKYNTLLAFVHNYVCYLSNLQTNLVYNAVISIIFNQYIVFYTQVFLSNAQFLPPE